ncbi:MAG: SulP family inorganic anion transporter [Burkholderiales bacterium]|nr:SulP family inorganic anion transporter [Burkholderiales bacterium]
MASPRLQDFASGLSIAGLLLPEAVAYASIGNLPPQAGVIALFAGLLCYGLLGSSRFAVVSATSSSAAVMAAATAVMANGDLALRLALSFGLILLTGVFFVLAAMARMGNASDFIAKPVLRGFAFGLTLVIILKQLPKMVGVHPGHGDTLYFVVDLFQHLTEWNQPGLMLGMASLATLWALSRWRRVPGALVVIVTGIALAHWVDLGAHGIETVGPIHLKLLAPSLPDLSRTQWMRLAEVAAAMAFVLYAESYGSVRTFAIKHKDGISPNRDLLALGAANLASGLFHGMPVGAGYSATSANEAAGAQSKLSIWICAAVVLLMVVTLLPAIALTPEPVLAAIVIHAVSHSLNLNALRPYFEFRRDRLVVIASILGVLALGVLDGLLAAIGLSLMMTIKRLSNATVSELGRLHDGHDFVSTKIHPDAAQIPGILILRPETPMFFANVDPVLTRVRQALVQHASTTTLIVSLEESPDLDGTCIEALREFALEIQASGKHLMLTRLKSRVQDVLLKASIPGLRGPALSDLSVDDAVRVAQSLHDAPNE